MVLWRAMPLSQEDDTLDELMAYGNGARVSIEENPFVRRPGATQSAWFSWSRTWLFNDLKNGVKSCKIEQLNVFVARWNQLKIHRFSPMLTRIHCFVPLQGSLSCSECTLHGGSGTTGGRNVSGTHWGKGMLSARWATKNTLNLRHKNEWYLLVVHWLALIGYRSALYHLTWFHDIL